MQNVWFRPIVGLLAGLAFTYLLGIDTIFAFIIILLSGVIEAEYNLSLILLIDTVSTFIILLFGVFLSFYICRTWYLTTSILFSTLFTLWALLNLSTSETTPLWYVAALYTIYIVTPALAYKMRKYIFELLPNLSDEQVIRFFLATIISMCIWPIFTVNISDSSWLIPLKMTLLLGFTSGFFVITSRQMQRWYGIISSVACGSTIMFVFFAFIIVPLDKIGFFKMM
ncbi:hypothetical protein BTJ40_12405 [Microbulbifer sp. A4B17]|uniref:hypothetical protein n=1 Tax=Microbulbifer sp. A4B17 TaxID=359370 RepID=UPI000D52DBAC|nr:hypothetical protein [Microbulbifer sp. A4B17]AWF81560.1 hypothetical protein BTJ40_12405 [Microbulbifer sp. A4B17]